MTPLQELLFKMAAYREYEQILDTPGLAFQFNEFVKQSLAIEKLVLDYFESRDIQSKRRKSMRKSK